MISIALTLILSQNKIGLSNEGVPIGYVSRIDCVGTGVACALAASGSLTGILTVAAGGGGGTVTDVSVVTVNGVSGTVATSTTTPAISITLGAITPTSVAASGTVGGSNLSGTNTGNVTLAAVGVVPNANGATLAGQVLNLQPASVSFPGVVSTTAQVFNGDKTNTGNFNVTGGSISVASTNSIKFNNSSTYAIRYILGPDRMEYTSPLHNFVGTPGTVDIATNLTVGTTIAATGAVTGSNLSGTNTGDQTITLTGPVTGSGTGTFGTTIGGGVVTDGNLANNYSGVGTCTNQFSRVLNDNAAPTCASVAIADHSATGTPNATTFYRGDNTWATPGGASPLTTKGDLYTYSTVDTRLPTSTDGLCLKTLASETTGLVWGACSAGASINFLDVTVVFATGNTTASTVVTGQAWVTAASKILCAPALLAATGRSEGAEDALIEGLTGAAHTRSAGVGFTLTAGKPSPGRYYGSQIFHCTGS